NMSKTNKLLLLLALLFAFSVFLAACSDDEASGGDDNGEDTAQEDGGDEGDDGDRQLADEQKLRFTGSDEIRSMDISIASATLSHGVMKKVFSGLLMYENDELVRELAEDLPETNDDNTEYTFTRRDGIEWSDGTPITADDFVYSWRRGEIGRASCRERVEREVGEVGLNRK